jgi:hypothetical protein
MAAGVWCVSRVTRIRGGAEFRDLEGTALCVAGGENRLKRNQLCWPEASGAKGMRVANFEGGCSDAAALFVFGSTGNPACACVRTHHGARETCKIKERVLWFPCLATTRLWQLGAQAGLPVLLNGNGELNF